MSADCDTVPICTTGHSGLLVVACVPPNSTTASARLRARKWNEQGRILRAEHFDAAE
jgi:hypothetical protein